MVFDGPGGEDDRVYAAVCGPEVPFPEQHLELLGGMCLVDLLECFSDLQCLHRFEVEPAHSDVVESLSLLFSEVLSVFEEDILGAVEDGVELGLHAPDRIDGFLDQGHDVESVEDDLCVREVLLDALDEGR